MTSPIECYISCILIVKNDNLNEEEKIKELTKKLVGTAGSMYVSANKTIQKGISKFVPKLLKILKRTTNLLLPKFTPIGVIGGFAIDCCLSYLVPKMTEYIIENLLDKIFDYFE